MIIDHTEKYENNTEYSDFVFKVYTQNPDAFVHYVVGVEKESLKYLFNADMLAIIVDKEKEMTESEKDSFLTWYC
jgi:hypothetical protein